jgi:hypothetical protein
VSQAKRPQFNSRILSLANLLCWGRHHFSGKFGVDVCTGPKTNPIALLRRQRAGEILN